MMSLEDRAPNEELLAHTARLEAALERIAAAHARAITLSGTDSARPDLHSVATRLDSTIARLRSALGEE